MEEGHTQHESTVASLKKKHQNATSEMSGSLDFKKGVSQEMPLPSKSCQWFKGGAGQSETLEYKHSPTDILMRSWSSGK